MSPLKIKRNSLSSTRLSNKENKGSNNHNSKPECRSKAFPLFKKKDPFVDYISKITDLTSALSYVNKSSPKYVMKWAKENSNANRPLTTINQVLRDEQKPRWNNNFRKTSQQANTGRYSQKIKESNECLTKTSGLYLYDINTAEEPNSNCELDQIVKSHNNQVTTCCVTPQAELVEDKPSFQIKLDCLDQSKRPVTFSMDVRRDSKTVYQGKRAIQTNRDFLYTQPIQIKSDSDAI